MLHYNLSNPGQKVQILARARVSNTPLNAVGPPQNVFMSQFFYGDDSYRIWATDEAAGDPLLSPRPWVTRNFRGRATP
jgi:hypothetical protein